MSLIIAAEAALIELKEYHQMLTMLNYSSCPGIQHCPTAAAIANLEVEIAKSKLGEDPEFPAVSLNPSDIVDVPAQPVQRRGASFLPGMRLCASCEMPLPSTTHESVIQCHRCLA